MIGGKVALKLAPHVLRELSCGVQTVTVTGTNGKSTTTRMVCAAVETAGPVISNVNGDNMPPGVTAAFISSPDARMAAIEVDEMHLPIVADQTDPDVMILLNLSRDQLDRVGEIGTVERRLRQAVTEHPDATVVANCDDPLIASAAWDGKHVVWVAAGSDWTDDSVGFPRGGRVVRSAGTWRVPGTSFQRPDPDWWLEDVRLGAQPCATLHGPDGQWPLSIALPGRANLANAAQAIAAAVTVGIPVEHAIAAVGTVTEVAGRYSTFDVDGREVHLMLAKNPAGWQEAMTMIDPAVNQVAVVVNGQIPDGQDLSWLWDVDFSRLNTGPARRVVAFGERGADLAVRLEYAGIHCTRVAHPMEAIKSFEPGPVEVLANYTSFRDLKCELDRLDRVSRATCHDRPVGRPSHPDSLDQQGGVS